MSTQISFHLLAEQELNEAAIYYDSQSPGLGHAFLDEMERAINLILEHPNASTLVDKIIYRKSVRRFSYSILYSIQPYGIFILAVANHKRRPAFWRGRQ